MEIRRLHKEDVEAAYALRLRALRESADSFGTTYEEYAALPLAEAQQRFRLQGDDFVLGAFLDNTLVGVVTFRRETRTKTRHKGQLLGMFVAEEARGKGIGRALVSGLIDEVRGLDGVAQINLDVFTTTTAARALYKSLGFEVCGLERNADKVGDTYFDSEMMVLFLSR